LSTPSFIMRFLRRETALSGFSLRLSFTVSIWSILGWCVQLPCSNSFSFFSTRVLYHDLLSLSSGRLQPPWGNVTPQKPPQSECSGVPFSPRLVALWYVWDMVWVVVSWAAVD
jgi:hypothetical protein